MLNSFTLIKNRRYFATLSPGLPVVCNPLAVWGARDEVGHCLATGVRWSEADDLSSSGLLDDCAVFATTRNGRVRGAVKSELSVYLRSLAFPVGNRLFSPCNDAFRKAVGRSGLELPDGQLTHILWHTFASHFPHQWRGHPRATTHPRAFGFEGHYV